MTVRSLFGVLLLGSSGAALAHHPLQGQPMETYLDGLLSGIGHPLLGFDHLFFIVALGLIATLGRARGLSIGAYLVAMGIGCLLRLRMPDLPLVEWLVAGSLLVAGGMLALAKLPQLPRLVPLLAGMGLFHGAAFGATLAAEEATAGTPVLLGYLIGLVLIQAVVAWAVGGFARVRLNEVGYRLSGAMVAGVGLFLLLESAEPMLLALVV